jgi:uncharacterized membrane protein
MGYVTVFDISKQQFEWWWPAIGLLILVLGIVCIKFVSRWPGHKNAKMIGWVMVVFGPIFTIIVYNSQTSMWAGWRSVYDRGAYSTVEGVVHDFKPMPYEGHQDECFWVKNQKFCYSDYIVQRGFRQSASHGGPIREGLPVRIAYYEGQILRLDVRADSLTPEAARAANAKAEQAKWQERAMSEPNVDRMLLGFSLFAVVISFLWNLDWRHYVRYWIRRDPPYSALLELAFRAFFLLSFVGAVVHLFQSINEKHRSVGDFEKAALFSLIWIIPFGVYDLVMRRRLRAKNPPPDSRPQPASIA